MTSILKCGNSTNEFILLLDNLINFNEDTKYQTNILKQTLLKITEMYTHFFFNCLNY